jgi:two-component system cell cycle response regulator CtrA
LRRSPTPRSRGHASSVVQTSDLVVNLDEKTAEINHVRVHLTCKEYDILELLSLRNGVTISKEMFLNQLYGGIDEPEIKIIDVFICKLRKRLADASNGKDYIETVWGRGYMLREPDQYNVRISACRPLPICSPIKCRSVSTPCPPPFRRHEPR